jgi:hypothetical protein
MSRLLKNSNHSIGALDHFQMAVLRPDLIPELFYEGQRCMHGHCLRHKTNHWCFNCAFKIYANQCGKNINTVHWDYHKYCFPVLADLPTDLDPAKCWDFSTDKKSKNPERPRFTTLTHRSFFIKQTESIALARFVYTYFWGDVGTLVTSKQCKNPCCWNPLHVKSKFNVKPMPKQVFPFVTQIDINQLQAFKSKEFSIEDELRPRLQIIKSPKENQEVSSGSRYRPLESQFLTDDRLSNK